MIDVFIAYSHNDLAYKNELKKFLRPLLREGRISVWDDYDIEAGQDWDAKIKERLYGAQIVLLLVSADSLASDFYMGINEVTFDEFDAFCDATNRTKPDDQGWGRGKRPVINVDWYDAVEYCNWLSQQKVLSAAYTIDKNTKDHNNSNSSDTKKWTVRINRDATGYRLPTEAEWEYAAREGGKKRRFGNGKDLLDPNEANFDASSDYKKAYSVAGTYRQKTVPVDEISGAANALGLRQMTGNVWEWCHDWYDAGYYDKSPGENPKGPDAGQYRVVRGGAWHVAPEYCRAADRSNGDPYNRIDNVGFRVVRHL